MILSKFCPSRVLKQQDKKGSHIILVKESVAGKRGVVVPNHKEIDRGTLLEIIRQSGLTKEEFIKLV